MFKDYELCNHFEFIKIEKQNIGYCLVFEQQTKNQIETYQEKTDGYTFKLLSGICTSRVYTLFVCDKHRADTTRYNVQKRYMSIINF